MLEGPDTHTIDAPCAPDAVQRLREVIERMQGQIKFQKTRIEALNFEVARLKR